MKWTGSKLGLFHCSLGIYCIQTFNVQSSISDATGGEHSRTRKSRKIINWMRMAAAADSAICCCGCSRVFFFFSLLSWLQLFLWLAALSLKRLFLFLLMLLLLVQIFCVWCAEFDRTAGRNSPNEKQKKNPFHLNSRSRTTWLFAVLTSLSFSGVFSFSCYFFYKIKLVKCRDRFRV